MKFSKAVILWYLLNKRDLPWRNTTNPYFIWLSEIMLQQTRVAQGLPYYFAFTEAFPTVFELANADEQQVLKLWQGLGYYSRARNLHATAKHISFELGGIFPGNYKDLLKLKGVGTYTAAAIASFSYGEAVPVVDGNVFRVLSRFFAVDADISQHASKKIFTELAFDLMPQEDAATFNQAIMEFGALQCIPKNPDCAICPLQQQCVAYLTNSVAKFPNNNKKLKISKRYFNYLVFEDQNEKLLIQKRIEKGIWQNLYEFPLIETTQDEDFEMFSQQVVCENAIEYVSVVNPEPIIHKLSHQHLHIKFWKIKVLGNLSNGIDYEAATEFPFPIVLHNFIENHYR